MTHVLTGVVGGKPVRFPLPGGSSSLGRSSRNDIP